MNTIMLNTFVVTAATGSVREAARRLRYGESTVAYHIKEIEKRCRTSLFDRQSRGLRLTRAGREAFSIAQEMLRMAAELESISGRSLGRGRPPEEWSRIESQHSRR